MKIKNFKLKINSRGFLRLTKRTFAVYMMAMVVITGSGLLYLFNPFVKKTEAAWFDDNWAYRKSIVITNNTSSENNVKATLSAYDASDTNKFQSDCGDVRFVKQNGDLLDYTVTSCGASTSFDIVFDTLAAGANIIYLYYGNPSAVNGFLSSTSAAACTNCSVGTPASEEKGTGPTLAWHFDDPAISSTIQDASQNNLDGTLNNTPAWQTEGMCIAGKCYLFDGSSNESVSKSDDAKLDFVAADNFTVQAWVKRNGAASANTIVLGKASANIGSTYQGYKLYMDASGDFCFDTQDGTLAVDTACTSAVEFDDEKWHFVQGVKTGTTKIELYVDGKLRASDSSIASTGSLANSGTFYVGIDSDGLAIDWKGFIDEVKVYPYARSASQIQNDFTAKGSSKGTSVLGAKDTKPLSEGLVGYWKEDETSGTSVTDSSGNGSTLTATTAMAATAGKFASAEDLESGSSEYQSVTDNATLSITGSLTLAAWIKPESVGAGTYNIIAKWDGANESYRLYQSADELVLEIESNNTVTTSATNLAASTWYHVAGVYDTASATAKIYVNGLEQSTTTSGTIPSSIADDGGKFHIGAEDSTTTAANFYDGIIDEARVYNRALTAAEVASLYNFAPGPLRHFKFDENTGLTVNDASGNGGTGTAGDMSWANGKYGSAGDFDGTDDYVGGGTATDIDNIPSGGGLTVSLWFNWNAIAANKTLITKDNNGTTGWKLQMTNSGNGTVLFTADLATTDISISVDVAPGSAISREWHYVAITFDNGSILSTPTAVAYFDGTVVQTVTGSGAYQSQSDAARDLEMGRQNASIGSQQWNGKIDDVRIYNYVRTAKQVTEDMNAGHPAPGSNASPVGYWKMDQGTGTTAMDSSGLSNGLTLSTASWTNAGKFDKAWNGTGGAVRMSRATDADLEFSASEDFTISLWFKTDSADNPANGTEYLISTTTDSTDVGYAVYAKTDGTICFGIDDDATWGPDIESCTTTDFYDGNWHHLVAVRDYSSTDKTYIYIDALQKDSDSDTTTGTLDGNNTFFVGDVDTDNNATSGIEEFAGDIDELKVFRAALTTEEIKQDYNHASSLVLGALSDTTSGNQIQSAAAEYCIPGDSTSCAGPVGEYRFDNNSDDTSTKGYGLSTNQASFAPGKYGAGIYRVSGNAAAVSDNDDFDVADDEKLTVEIWFRSNGQNRSARRVIIGNKTGETPTSAGYQITILTNGTLEGIVGNGTTQISLTTTSTVDDSIWHHAALTIDATTSGTSSLYLDGVLLDTDTTPTGSLGNTDPLAFGYNDSNSAVFPFIGWLDHAVLYKYIRSFAQIRWDMNRGAPVGHWKFDECQGTTINDSSGNSFTGTLTLGGAPISSAGDCTTSATTSWNGGSSGKINSSIKLDGTDDYVSVSDTANLRFDASTDDFSLFAWVKRVTTGTEYILSKEDADNDGWRLLFSSNNVVCSEDATDVTSSSTITDTNWHFVGCTIDRDGNGQVYIDGRADGSATSMGTDAMATTSNLLIGTRSYTSTNYLNGQIDDVKIFNYALTAKQVQMLYTGGAARYAPVTGTP